MRIETPFRLAVLLLLALLPLFGLGCLGDDGWNDPVSEEPSLCVTAHVKGYGGDFGPNPTDVRKYTITVMVSDCHGYPIEGAIVYFMVDVGSLSSSVVTTDAAGEASVQLIFQSDSGVTVTIIVMYDGQSVTGSFNIWGSAHEITLTSGGRS